MPFIAPTTGRFYLKGYCMKYELVPHDTIYYEPSGDAFLELDFEEICELSSQEDMKALDPITIKNHPIGMAMVSEFMSPHWVFHCDVMSYAGVTGFEKYDGKNLAVVGGIITLPQFRNQGVGTKTVAGLLNAASTPEMVAKYGHKGFIAKCNADSKLLTEKLGFTEVGHKLGKLVMVKML